MPFSTICITASITSGSGFGVGVGFARQGGSALFYSTELDELVHLCERCIVLYRGAIVAELRAEELAPELLLSIAAGHRSQVDRALLADNSANGVSV